MKVFESSVVTIEWNEAIQAVHLTWRQFAESRALRLGLEKGLEIFYQKRCRFWLADTARLSAIGNADQRWIDQDWFPRLVSAGLERMAVVIPTQIIGHSSVKAAVDRASNGGRFDVQYFTNVNEAESWLSSNVQYNGERHLRAS